MFYLVLAFVLYNSNNRCFLLLPKSTLLAFHKKKLNKDNLKLKQLAKGHGFKQKPKTYTPNFICADKTVLMPILIPAMHGLLSFIKGCLVNLATYQVGLL